MPQLIEVTHIFKRGASLRITFIPAKMHKNQPAITLAGDIVEFYEEDGIISSAMACIFSYPNDI